MLTKSIDEMTAAELTQLQKLGYQAQNKLNQRTQEERAAQAQEALKANLPTLKKLKDKYQKLIQELSGLKSVTSEFTVVVKAEVDNTMLTLDEFFRDWDGNLEYRVSVTGSLPKKNRDRLKEEAENVISDMCEEGVKLLFPQIAKIQDSLDGIRTEIQNIVGYGFSGDLDDLLKD